MMSGPNIVNAEFECVCTKFLHLFAVLLQSENLFMVLHFESEKQTKFQKRPLTRVQIIEVIDHFFQLFVNDMKTKTSV